MKKTIITLLALCGVASAANVTKDDFEDNLNRVSIFLDDVATSFSSGTFAVSFEAESSYALDLSLRMGSEDEESFYISVSGNNTYLSITAPNVDLMSSMAMRPAEYSGSFLLQCVNNNGLVITLSHFDEGTQHFTPIHEVTTNCTFPSSLNMGTSNGNSYSPVSELRTWEGIVTETEMANPPAALSPGVPEPTTASLSLLALAGLAARRRRK